MVQMIQDPSFDNPGGGGGGYTPPPATGQGWTVNATTHEITFSLAPVAGTNNIKVNEYTPGSLKGTTKFAIGSWCDEYGYPTECEFFSDRLWHAGTTADPQMIWGSQTGDYTNFGRSSPIVDSDAVSFAINARQVNAIMDLVPLDKMIVLAKSSEFLLTGGQNEVISPTTINIKPQSYHGSNGMQAKVVGDTAIFQKEQGQHVFDIGYRFESDGYKPNDISAFAAHLFEGHTFKRMEWVPAPWQTLVMARGDGVELGCTYMPIQEVLGWHRHDTGRTTLGYGDDAVEDIVALPGGNQTEVFYLTRRTISGVTKRYIEQAAPIFVDDIQDWFYVDCGLKFDGRNTTATTVTLTTAAGWSGTDDITLTASSALFVGATDVGDGFTIYRTITELDDNSEPTDVVHQVRVIITAYVSPTVVTVRAIGGVPTELQAIATAQWTIMRDTISGLGHLEGRRVAIYADGAVISNGRTGTSYVVTGGSMSMPTPVGVCTIGLPYRTHLETLSLTVQNAPPVRGDKKLLWKVGVHVRNTRGVRICGGKLRADYTYDMPQREEEDYAEPTQPLTGYGEVPVDAEWGEDVGKLHLIIDDPLPFELLAVLPKFVTSDIP